MINGRFSENVVKSLTWTQNDCAEDGGVEKMLLEFTRKKSSDNLFYFAGHRPVSGKYCLTQNGKFIQIHNPEEQNIALVYTDRVFNPDNDIVSVAE